MTETRVIHLRSISYTGTTWINLVVGSAPNAFPIGPADRFFDLYDSDPARLCLVHGADCTFWPEFARSYSPEGSFFNQLAQASGKSTIVTNNLIPNKMGLELERREVATTEAIVVRDGRAVVASYARKFADGGVRGAIEWYRPAAESMFALSESAKLPVLRYEDFVEQNDGIWERTSDDLSLELSAACLDFYACDHHPISGNQGTFALMRRHQGVPIPDFSGSSFYKEAFESASDVQAKPILDNRWRSELTPDDLALFETECGATNRAFGYS